MANKLEKRKTSVSTGVGENTESSEDSASSHERFNLKEKIGLRGGVAIIAGTMVGSGIFVSPIGVLRGTNGSVGLSLILWAFCGVISCVAALCYAELASMFRVSGSTYSYLHLEYGRGGPVLSFTYAWTIVLITQGASKAATSLIFGSYLLAPFYSGDCNPPVVLVKCAAAAAILSVVFLNYYSVKASSKLVSSLFLSKFIGMGIIIVGGLVRLIQGDSVGVFNFNNAFQQEDLVGLGFTEIGLAFYQGLFSYGGWATLALISEEVKDAKRTVPLAIVIAVPLVTVFYLLVNIAYLSVLTPEEMLTSDAVAVSWGYRVLGNSAGWLMSVVVCLSTLGALCASYLAGGRLPYVAARNGHLPQIFEMATVDYHTPGPALLMAGFLSLLYLIPNDFNTLIGGFSFTSWLFYALVVTGVIILRFTHKDHPRPFKVPIILPILTIIIAVYLVVAPLVESPSIFVIYALTILLCGPLVFFMFVHKNFRIPGIDHLTMFLQQLLNVAPTDWHIE